MPRDDQYALIVKQGSNIHRHYATDSASNTVDSLNQFFHDMPSLNDREIEVAGYFLKQASALYGIPLSHTMGQFEKDRKSVV